MLLRPEDIIECLKIVPKRKEHLRGHVPSAILMIFFNKENKTHLVYIRRTQDMTLHSGQMAFPGGKIDSDDATSYAAAVRETNEEIGVSEKEYRYLGDMGFFHTFTTRYDAAAHLVWSSKRPKYKTNKIEVAEVIEIPLTVLLQQFRPDVDFNNAQELWYLNFKYKPPNSSKTANLWGLTARITHHFMQGLATFLQNRN
ncbi:MAG: NUDIX hydrolase [bacterium]